VACSSTHGHQWPTVNRAAFNTWAATTLASHPKGTPASAFVLPPPPPGYSCRIGPYIDHYERACSIDADGDIDRDDIALITAARNQPASGPTDLRDVDRNGVIDVNDARACTLRCDRPNCAVQ
jgi:hypothetical protein